MQLPMQLAGGIGHPLVVSNYAYCVKRGEHSLKVFYHIFNRAKLYIDR